MKKIKKIISVSVLFLVAFFAIFGVSKLAAAEDVIGRVTLYKTGDYNCDGQVNSDDAIYLLMHTQFNDKDPAAYPVSQSADINKDENINSDDAIYLLMYTQFPENYPIE